MNRRPDNMEANRRRIERATSRGIIVGMSMGGRNPTEIAAQLGVSRSTVYRWKNRWEEEGYLGDKPRSGCPRSTTRDQDRQILEIAERDHFTNAEIIKEQLHLQVTPQTVRRRLHEEGIHHRTPSIKDKLTEAHKRLRLQFAEQYVDEDLDFWGRVVFSDEKTFSSTNHGRIHCWRKNNTRQVIVIFSINQCSSAKNSLCFIFSLTPLWNWNIYPFDAYPHAYKNKNV